MSPPNWLRPPSLAQALGSLRLAVQVADGVRAQDDEPMVSGDCAPGDVRLLAGGQTLIPAMRLGLDAPALLIDLQDIPELRGLAIEHERLWIGAMNTHAQIAASPLVRGHQPGLARLAAGIADQQVRNRGTLGGSIANADPAACWPAGLLALAATVVTDRREMAADDFFRGMFETALEPDEIIRGVGFPLTARVVYLKFEQPASRFALVGVAVAKASPTSVRVAVTGLGNGVCRWPEAEARLGRHFAPTALDDLPFPVTRANGDLHASAGYRAHLVAVLTQRAVQFHG